MKKIIFTTIIAITALTAMAQRKTDVLDRGLVALPNSSGIFLSWRILPEEYYNVKYNVYRNGTKLNETPLSVSNYVDTSGSTSNSYTIKAVKNGVEQTACTAVTPWTTCETIKYYPTLYYKQIQMADVFDRNNTLVFCACGNHTVSDANAQEYTINDVSLGDVDGDGQIDFIVKRINNTDRGNLFPTDNTTAFCRIEVYASSQNYGLLWYIDCGPNTVYGSDEQWDAVAFDWDQDGRCEVLYRAYANTVIHKADGSTVTIGSANENIRAYVSHVSNMTFTNCGNEYLVYMDGKTGNPYVTMDYPLKRLESSEFSTSINWDNPNSTDVTNYLAAVKTAWGDNYGHRSSKYFMGAPYLDGRTPSIYLGRGIYTRHKMIALDVNPTTHALTTRWTWNCNDASSTWYGNGFHNFTVADVDEDGRDEIVYGSMVIDDNGKGLSTTGYHHGDAQHTGDLDPFRKGLETYVCNEESPYFGSHYRNATTSEMYYVFAGSSDDGRCLAANLSNDYPGCVGASTQTGVIALSAATPGPIDGWTNNWNPGSGTPSPSALNSRIYWDGDLLDETLNGPGASNDGNPMYVNKLGTRLIMTGETISNNGTKKNPGAQGDILGDWREELVLRTSDNTALRIYTTNTPTDYRIPSLWFDHQYRQAMVWQSEGYNQPPHTSFFLGELEGITQAPPPLTNTGRTELSANGIITSSHNNAQVMLCDAGNYGVDASGASPELLVVNAPSIVSGNDNNDNISYTYKQIQLGATINSTNYKGDLTGAMRLVKQGDGLLKLTARTFSYTGNTDVWAGSLYFRGTLSNSPVWMNRHTSLYTAGTYKRKVTMEYGSTLNLNYTYSDGTTEYSTATIDTLELHEGARVVFDIDQSSSQSDVLNMKHLILRTQEWEYGPEYLTPVLQINSTSALAKGMYPIGTIDKVSGSLDDIEIECNMQNSSYLKSLYVGDGTLYLRIYDSTEAPDPRIKMTYVNYDAPATSYGEVTTAMSGYNKLSDGSVAMANTAWAVDYITYIQVDASAYKGYRPVGDVMKINIDVSGSMDSKRGTSWGLGYNSSAWSSDMTYNTADKTITTIGDVQSNSNKSASTYVTLSWDIKSVFDADADGILTLVLYETAAAGGYVKNATLTTDYEIDYQEETTPTVTTVALTDDTEHSATANATYESVSYTRDIASAEVSTWTPIYLPFSFNVSDYSSAFEIAEIFAFCPYQDTNGDGTIDASDDDMLIVSLKSSGQTVANTPYLLRPKTSGSQVITSADGILYAAANGSVRTATTKAVYSFTGINKETAANASNGFYYLSAGTLSNVSSGSVAIKPYRWYATVTQRTDNYGSSTSQAAAKPSFCIAVIGEDLDEATAIQIVRNQQGTPAAGSIYNLVGNRMDAAKSLPRGIYIQNNKKVAVSK